MWKVQANDGGQQTNFDQRSYLKLKVLHTYSSHILRNSFLLILLKGNNTSKTEWMLNFVKLSEFWLLSLTKWIKKKTKNIWIDQKYSISLVTQWNNSTCRGHTAHNMLQYSQCMIPFSAVIYLQQYRHTLPQTSSFPGILEQSHQH